MEKSSGKKTAKWPVEIIRSRKRKRTISAELKNGVLVISAPAHLTDAELQPHIDSLSGRLARRMRRAQSASSDADLAKLALELNARYFNGKLTLQSIRYVTNQQKRYGSCTPSTGTIRISDRLATMPRWVLEYVIVHELAHLLEPNHSPRFWEWVNRYPLAERARGYLMAVGLEEE